MKRKSDLSVVVMKGMTMMPIFLHISYTAIAATLHPLSPYYSFLILTMWHFS